MLKGTHIVTTAEIFVNESFIKDGNMSINSGTTIPVTVLGGTVGNTTEWVEDMPAFSTRFRGVCLS